MIPSPKVITRKVIARILCSVLTATASYPYEDGNGEALGLRGQLRILAIDARVDPVWDSFKVSGPVTSRGAHGLVWYCWTATIETQEPTS